MEIIGFVASIVMGLTLGLVGGGGSILTVPILVYLFDVDPVLSTAYSLFVVGLTSVVGSFSHFKKGNVHLKTALIFGVPSIAAVYSVRKFLMPVIPDPVFNLGSVEVSKSMAVLVLFAVLMLVASVTMIIKPKTKNDKPAEIKYNYPLIFIEGIVVGAITGLGGCRRWISYYSCPCSIGGFAYETGGWHIAGNYCTEVSDRIYGRSRWCLGNRL